MAFIIYCDILLLMTILLHLMETVRFSVKLSTMIFYIDVINVYNVYKKILCKRVYYCVNVYLNKIT